MRKRHLLAAFSLLLIGLILSAAAETMPSVRVWLRRLQITDRLQISTHGRYVSSDGRFALEDGTEAVILKRGKTLVLSVGNLQLDVGASVTLNRCEESGWLTLKPEKGRYEGNLTLDISEDSLRAILTIPLESYLLGVVPYEMGDAFRPEALKAQAIAARNYALTKIGSSDAYDLEDTTNDQAFRGRSDSSPKSEQAVLDTAGTVGLYKGKIVTCYYAASNGGQTELAEKVWPDRKGDFGYMDQRDDPYDLESTAAVVRRCTLRKKLGDNRPGDEFAELLLRELKDPLALLGYECEADLVRFDGFESVALSDPKYEGSHVMTRLTLGVRVSVRGRQGEGYTAYRKLEGAFPVTLPIFPEAEKALGLSISVASNEIWTVVDAGSSFLIEARRYGHGVGMSQRGAEIMAAYHGKNCEDILAFYYPGMTLETKAYDAPTPAPYDAERLATPAPTPTPTPRPTAIPVSTSGLAKGEYAAKVANIDDDSYLNLRASASFSADVVWRLLKGQTVIVEREEASGWVKVRIDPMEGYVRTEYIEKIRKKK